MYVIVRVRDARYHEIRVKESYTRRPWRWATEGLVVRCVGDRNGSVGFNLSIPIMGGSGGGGIRVSSNKNCAVERRERSFHTRRVTNVRI